MKVSAIRSTQQNNINQNFNGKFIFDEQNLTKKQRLEVRQLTKIHDISKKPFDVSFYNDPISGVLVIMAENKSKNQSCSVDIIQSRQRTLYINKKFGELMQKYEDKFIYPNTIMGKITGFFKFINPL